MKPLVKTSLPGPKAKKIIKKDSRVVSPSYTREYPLVIDKAKDVWVWDVDGNRFLDFVAGIAVANAGRRNPEVMKAAKKQMGKAVHAAFSDFYSVPAVEFSEELFKHMPRGFNKIFFSNSGTESVEAAYKIVKWHTRKEYVMAFKKSFHGRTMGSLSLTYSKPVHRQGFEPFLPVIHTDYAYCYRCPYGLTYPDCGLTCIQWVKERLKGKSVGGLFVEPMQGEGGYIVPPKEFHKELRRLCDEKGIILVDDEIQAGCYRTGKMLAMQHFGVKPDVVCLSKAIGGGFPMGVTLTGERLMKWPPGAHANTMGGHMVACAAGLASLKQIKKKKLDKNAAKQGKYIMKRLKAMKERHEIIGDVRGLGLMIGIEFVEDKKSKKPAKEKRDKVIQECFTQGLLLLPCGENVCRFSPALTIKKPEIDLALSIFEDAVKKQC
jgi:4-aminobutyrate aminotransferase